MLHVDNNRNLGNFIILDHGEYQTLYAHLSVILVNSGEQVSQGQLLGRVGDKGHITGYSNGYCTENCITEPHLHFEVFCNGIVVDPLEFLDSDVEPIEP